MAAVMKTCGRRWPGCWPARSRWAWPSSPPRPPGARGAPVVAVGEAAINLTPVPVKEFAITHFGTHDKQALVAGILVLLAGFAAVIGRAGACGGWPSGWPGWRRSPRSA